MSEEIRYDAFISYRHCNPDKEIAIKLHKALENFRLPHSVSKKIGKRKLERVFRDEAELAVSAELSEEIEKALLHSEYLIVICTPRLQESEWCMKEIDTFLKISDRNHILLVLAEGEPEDSFPEILTYEDVEKKTGDGQVVTIREKREPLAGDCRGDSARKRKEAFQNTVMRLCATMFGLHFDDLKQRQKERKMRSNGIVSALIFLVVFCIGAQNTYFLTNEKKQKALIEDKLATITANSSMELLEDGRRKDAIYVAKSVLPNNSEKGFNQNAYRALQNAMGIYSRPDLFTAEKNITVFPNYVYFNYDASLISAWDSQNQFNVIDAETGEIVCSSPLQFGSEAEFYGTDSVLTYEEGKLTQIDISTNQEKEIKIPKTENDSIYKHLFTLNGREEIAVLLLDGVVYGIIDGVCKYKIDISALNMESGNTEFNEIIFSENGKVAIACTYSYEDGSISSIVEFKTDTGEILYKYETELNVSMVAPVENGFYILRVTGDEAENSGTEIMFFDTGKGRLLFSQFLQKEYYYSIACIGNTVTVYGSEKIVVMNQKLQVLNSMSSRHYPTSVFSYQGNPAFIIDDETAYIWNPENNSFDKKIITSEKLEVQNSDEVYLDENKFQLYHWGSDHVTVYKKNVTDCLVEIKELSYPEDEDYEDEYNEETETEEAETEEADVFAANIFAQEGVPIVFTDTTADKKYYVLQMQDFQIRFYDVETEECVRKNYIAEGTLWRADYCEKYDCYFLEFYGWNGSSIVVIDSDLNYIASLSECYLSSIDGGIDGDPVVWLYDDNSEDTFYYSLKLLEYEEVMQKADNMLDGYVPDGNTLERYGLTP